jgi:hypothetical protein
VSNDDHAVKPSEALAVVDAVVFDADADPAACPLCGGPVRICGGTRRCMGGHLDPLERRWVTAIRLVYAGLCLTPTAAALWGGALLRLADLLTRGTSVSPAFVDVAAEYANPGGALPSDVAAHLAVTYLQHRDVDRLDDLFRSLRDADAPWLVEIRILGPRAALATPLEHARFALFAVPCADCAASTSTSTQAPLFTHVGTYDAAIRCPHCGLVAAHPLPVRIGDPHPVARCLGARTSCLAHDGYELDAAGLCLRGRATLDRARREAKKIGRVVTAQDRELIDALDRARQMVPLPFVAAVAALDPRAARALVRIPNFGKLMRVAEELANAFTSGLDKVLFSAPKPKVLPTSAPRPKRRRQRKGAKR